MKNPFEDSSLGTELLELCRQNIEIRYLDDHIIVSEKPRGLITSEPGYRASGKDSLEKRLKKIPEFANFWAAHRIDKDTTGLVMFARGGESLRSIQDQFRFRKVHKEYLVVVDAYVNDDEKGSINAKLRKEEGTSSSGRYSIVCVNDDGKEALTEYVCVANQIKLNGNGCSMMLVKTHSGRTHQIRVHMQHQGWQVHEDPHYNTERGTGQFLHAARLIFMHPVGRQLMEFTSLPDWTGDKKLGEEFYKKVLNNSSYRAALQKEIVNMDGWPHN